MLGYKISVSRIFDFEISPSREIYKIREVAVLASTLIILTLLSHGSHSHGMSRADTKRLVGIN